MSLRATTWVPGAFAAVSIVGILSWMFMSKPEVSPEPGITESRAVVASPTKNNLAALEPPVFRAGNRDVPKSQEEPLFKEAMAFYQQRDYTRASYALQQATARQPENPEMRFYLGVCFLLTDDVMVGIRELKVAAQLGDSPYADRIHFYLAKAYVKQNDTTNAMRELASVARGTGDLAEPAKKLRLDLATSSLN